MKIKIIDLLNMISKGEEVPKKIKFDYQEYEYNDLAKTYYCGMNTLLSNYKFVILNDEVEIIEEKKIPEKIKSNGKEFYCDNIDSWIDKEKTSAYCEYLMNKYNDLIDYLKSKGE